MLFLYYSWSVNLPRMQNARKVTRKKMIVDYTAVAEDEEEVVDLSEFNGTVLSSCLSISNTILGSGMLAMPLAFNSSGLGLGIILVGICAVLSSFGLYLLSRLAAHIGRKSSFNACSKITLPTFEKLIDWAIAVKCFGVSISYLVIAGDLLVKVLHGVFPSIPADSILLYKTTWTTVAILLVSPLAFLSKLTSLRYTSSFALSAVFYLLFVVLVHYFLPPPEMPPPLTDIVWFKFNGTLISKLPIFVFAFTCHQNIFAVYNELGDNTQPQVNKVISRSVGSAFVVYQTIGIVGYLTFGNMIDFPSNVISKYPNSGLITGGQLAISLLVLCSYPLQCHPCRASIEKIFWSRPLAPKEFNLVTICLLVCSYLIAITISDLSTILAIVGATGSTTICHLLPGIII
jgi:amino acid permease